MLNVKNYTVPSLALNLLVQGVGLRSPGIYEEMVRIRRSMVLNKMVALMKKEAIGRWGEGLELGTCLGLLLPKSTCQALWRAIISRPLARSMFWTVNPTGTKYI
jgi:hypothetical protein